ncbi:hypothetical protein [Bradyrhizobium guangdongense]|uniref:Uncharacterized protein n=1 Tax=Bradyrhizobium guangdongense TaxID=1325090 RepID=A0A410VAL5_9BRAD|nr:hypothetical protein [Bradyrhizobium guangdongense]QAU40741.1 hypothetical protein X265_25970 [Bradyrhizobium guangdongense]QOZ61802.1 hypothetical protein XH86_25995 [Bradyrhizobium guangdongense]GGI21812.1 hypothetical protein GCM10010987_16210 [Bradyrhizobium guangdongense]
MHTQHTRTPYASAALIVLVCVMVDVALHRLFSWTFDFDYFDNGLPQSVFVRNGTFPLAAVAGFLLMFGFLAAIFLRVRPSLGKLPLPAGQCFFMPIALIMFFGVLESAFVFPTPLRAEIITGVADALPYLLLGLLLDRFVRPMDGLRQGPAVEIAPWWSMLWVALFYVGGRYVVSYPVLHIASGYIARPAGTLIWTVACGLSVGAFHWLAGSAFPAATPLQKALRVAATLGIFWLMVQLFYALISAVSVADLVIRGAADTVYLAAGIYSLEALLRRSKPSA